MGEYQSVGGIGQAVSVVYGQLPLLLISVHLLNRINILNIIPAHRYYGGAIFSCKYVMLSSCLSIIIFDIILYLECLMNRLMLDGTSIPSRSRIKMLDDKNYTLKIWIELMVSAEKVPVDDNYFYFSPLLQKECERQEIRKCCFSL